MPYNYAQTMLSDQTNFCSHQMHGVLVFGCTVHSLCLFVVRNNSSCPTFFFVWKQKSSDFEHSISLFGSSTLILYSGTNCVWTFWKITGAFLTLAHLYFAVRLLIKLFTICCDSHFWEDLSVEPDFVKALLYWPFWYMPVAVTISIIKPVDDKCLTFTQWRCVLK